MSIGIKLGIFSELDAAAAGGGEVTPGSILLTPSAQGTHTEWHTNDFIIIFIINQLRNIKLCQ